MVNYDSADEIEGMDISYESHADEDMDSQEEESFEDVVSTQELRKNLAMTFDNAIETSEEKKRLKNTVKSNNTNSARPPMVPPTKARMTIKRNHEVTRSTTTTASSTTDSSSKDKDDRKPLLSVYLRVRPPVAPGINDPNASVNTIEILTSSDSSSSKSTSIRTYPPVTSNAAKNFRSDNKKQRSNSIHNRVSHHDIATGITSMEDHSSNNNNNSSNPLATGVKEFDFNQVFQPESSQEEVYTNVAAPLVQGLFPKILQNNVDENIIDNHGLDDARSPLKKRVKPSNECSTSTAPKDPQLHNSKGQSALLFAYGITNAGKTHTIVGDTSTKRGQEYRVKPEAGILPRALQDMLNKVEDAKKKDPHNDYLMHMSYLEIYNENIYDLLCTVPNAAQTVTTTSSGYDSSCSVSSTSRVTRSKTCSAALRLREDRNGHIFVKGLSKHPITSVSQGIKLANIAKEKRHTSSNNINNDSSRSHCVCQLELTTIPINSPRSNRSTFLWVVDLAGIERSKRTGMVYRSTRQKEAAVINSSLMKLMRCLQTMCNNQQNQNGSTSGSGTSSNNTIVPFRESKLTHLFMNHLTGASASQTSMIVNINPASADYDETQHVLSYATVARAVKISSQEYLEKFSAIAGISLNENVNVAAHNKKESSTLLEPVRVSNEGGDESSREGRSGARSPTKKVKKMVQKLSPRAMLKKKREKKAAERAKANEFYNNRYKSTSMALDSKTNSSKSDTSSSSSTRAKYKKEVEELRASLQELQEENETLREAIEISKEDQLHRDSELRMEVVQEMEKEIREIREHYEALLKKNKGVSNPTPLKTIKALQTQRQEQFIKELMEKNDECEDEMVRMSERHAQEINNMRQLYDEAIQCKDAEIDELKRIYKETNQNNINELHRVKDELNETQQDYEHLKGEHSSLLAFVEGQSVGCGSSDDNASNEDFGYDQENIVVGSAGKSGLRRLPRGRISEVACGDVTMIQPSSSSKKKASRGLLSKKSPNRSPFTSISVPGTN